MSFFFLACFHNLFNISIGVTLQLAVEESKSFRERSMTLVLVPNKAVVQKAPESPKKKEKTASEVSAGV